MHALRMEAPRTDPAPQAATRVDWEAFYRSYRKPGYVPGFEIVTKLGGGMFGLVFKARKESIGKDYAIKFLKVDDDTVRDAVVREIDNVGFFAQIDHPNLVSIEDKGSVDGIPFLVMSYAGDETLQTRLQNGGIGRDEAMRIFVETARGVQALHEHSLVHFDLKPANIFLKGDVARVGDYGLSKLVSVSRNSLSFGRGTPYYMAPELLQRRGDARSDQYSLGIILFECLYGDVPFRGDSEWEVLKKHEVAMPQFPPHADPNDRMVIQRCLAKRPEDRFASVAELLRALQAPVSLGESLRLMPSHPTGESSAPCVGPLAGRVLAEPSPRLAHTVSPSSPPPLPRDPAESPYGMPRSQDRPRGLLAFLVRGVFAVFELAIWAVLVPVRAVSVVFGRGILWALKLPFRILGLTAQLIGLLLVFALLVLLIVGVLGLVM